MVKQFFYLLVLILSLHILSSHGQAPGYPINVKNLFARDPFIYADTVSKKYYMHLNDNLKIGLYESPDLENWKRVRTVFLAPENYWGTNRFWAPDTFFYNGKYYMFVTFGNDFPSMEGTSVLVSDKIDGTFEALVNGPVTPVDWHCLDGSLYIDDDGQPWVVFCRAWTEVINGEIHAQKLSPNLEKAIEDPILLFKASSAPWVGTISSGAVTGRVTDAPIIYRANNGELLLLWSSFTKSPTRYAIGVARSSNGKIDGVWTQDPETLNNEPDGGGHAMIFRDFNNELRIAYHSPNSGATRPLFLYLDDNNGTLTIRKSSSSSKKNDSLMEVIINIINDQLHLKFPVMEKKTQLSLFDLHGKMLRSESFEEVSSLKWSLAGLLKGVYLLQIKNDDGKLKSIKVLI